MSQLQGVGPVSGFVFRVDRDRGPQWYAKWREPGGRQVKRRIGPAWTGRGRPDPGFFTKRTAEECLRVTLAEAEDDAERGVDRDVTFATAAAEWLRYVEHDRAVKPSTPRDYRSGLTYHLLTDFGARRLRDITPAELERWRSTLTASPRTKNKLIVCSRPKRSAPTSAPSKTASNREARARHRAAHLMAPRRSTSRGRPQGPSLRFDSSPLAPRRTLPRQAVAHQADLTFVRRPKGE